jgi:hypothetical protein
MTNFEEDLLFEQYQNLIKEYKETGLTDEQITAIIKEKFSEEELAIIEKYKTKIPTLEDIKMIVNKNFPELWPVVETCLSVISTLLLKDLKDPTGLNLIGDPSSEKGTVLSFFYGIDKVIYRTDDFSPRSFVTGLNIKDEERLREIDLLPRVENKTILIPELAPIFGKRKEDLVENLSILTRVFDGHGLVKDFGSVGRRGYERPIVFAWIGATTPLENRIWTEMIRLGTRMFFYNMQLKEESLDELVNSVFKSGNYNEKIKEVNEVIRKYLDGLFAHGFQSIEWDKTKDEEESLYFITELAQLLTKLRAPLMTWKSESEDEETSYEYVSPMKERPKRAMQILYNIARGHAIINGRNFITKDDTKILINIVFSSMPDDRRKVWNLLIENDGYLDYAAIKKGFSCSKRHAYRIMKILDILGVAEMHETDSEDEYDKERKHLELKDDLKELISKIKEMEKVN